MSKIVHPYAHRLIILRDWKSRWFADPKKYVAYLKGDVLIRQYLEKKLRGMYISTIEIERSRKATRFIIKTRPINRQKRRRSGKTESGYFNKNGQTETSQTGGF